jgi:5-methylcytosine-specific restriction protein A
MMTPTQQTLAELKPRSRRAVMDLVQEAGIDVGPWKTKRDGTPVKEPRANPHYCYEWAFGNETEGFVLCVWHASLNEINLSDGPALGFQENLRQLALSLDRIAIDRTRPSDEQKRARDQAARARSFDRAVQLAFRHAQPMKLIINEGDRRALEELGKGKSTVKLRQLDSADWFVHSYDNETGECLLVRGSPAVSLVVSAPAGAPEVVSIMESPVIERRSDDSIGPEPKATVYVDQFSAPVAATQREVTALVRDRSTAVRERVLLRAKGFCELCGEPGFVTAAGSIYLETHHVVPLSRDGPDHESNVVALCPNDHRRAHFGNDREAMTAQLQAIVDKGSANMLLIRQ